MPNPTGSLIAAAEAAPQQLDLLPEDQMPAALFAPDSDLSSIEGQSTGERLFQQNPLTYRVVITLLARGIGILRITRVTRVHPRTVMAIRDRESGPIEMEKQRIAVLMKQGVVLCAEAILDRLSSPIAVEKIPAKDLGILLGILTEKHELLTGGATFRGDQVQHPARPAHEDWEAYVKDLPEADVHVLTGSEGERSGQKGEGSGGTEADVVVQAAGAIGTERQLVAGADVIGDQGATGHKANEKASIAGGDVASDVKGQDGPGQSGVDGAREKGDVSAGEQGGGGGRAQPGGLAGDDPLGGGEFIPKGADHA